MPEPELAWLAREVKAHVSVSEAADWFGFEYRTGLNRFVCPLCEGVSSSRKTLALYPDESGREDVRWYCFHCAEGGDVIDWIAARLGVTKGSAIHVLADRLGLDPTNAGSIGYLRTLLTSDRRAELAYAGTCARLVRAVKRKRRRLSGPWDTIKDEWAAWDLAETMAARADERAVEYADRITAGHPEPFGDIQQFLDLNEAACVEYMKALHSGLPGRDYRMLVRGRGLVPSLVAARLGCSPLGLNLLRSARNTVCAPEEALIEIGLATPKGRDMMRGRLVFPIFDVVGRVIAFAGRVIDDSRPKYINTRDTILFDKSRTLYGLEAAAPSIRSLGYAMTVEGYTDVRACHRFGIPVAVAAMGTGFTDQHAEALARLARYVLICTDADDAGDRAAVRQAEALRAAGVRFTRVRPPDHDPDQALGNPVRAASFLRAVREAVAGSGPREDRESALPGLRDRLTRPPSR